MRTPNPWRAKLLAALLTIMASQAQADTINTMPKTAGGSVMIFTLPCLNGHKGNLAASTATSGAIETYGCASKLTKSLIHIRWGDGKSDVFPAGAFTAQQVMNGDG